MARTAAGIGVDGDGSDAVGRRAVGDLAVHGPFRSLLQVEVDGQVHIVTGYESLRSISLTGLTRQRRLRPDGRHPCRAGGHRNRLPGRPGQSG